MSKIPESTVRRLSLYLRFLEEFEGAGATTVSSEALADRGGTTSAQVRKDLSLFGSFGKRGLGYAVPELANRLRDILGVGTEYRVIVVGVGKIGRALIQYRGFADRGFVIVGAYDLDEATVDTQVDGLTVRHVDELERDLAETPADVAILATPADAAEALVRRLAACAVRGILNFAPATISAPDGVTVKDVNLVLELEALSYALRNG